MTYVMTKPCPVCKQQLTKRLPPIPYSALAVSMFGRDSRTTKREVPRCGLTERRRYVKPNANSRVKPEPFCSPCPAR